MVHKTTGFVTDKEDKEVCNDLFHKNIVAGHEYIRPKLERSSKKH